MNKFKISCLIPVLFLLLAPLPACAQQTHSLNDELLYRLNFGTPDEVKLLLDKGANPNAVSTTGDYAIAVAIDRDDGDAAQFIQLLLSKGANPNMRDKSGLYPIVAAIMNNRPAAAFALIAGGADYHVKSPNGRSLVEIATQNHAPELAKTIQDKLDEEARHEADMRTPERFKMIVHQYVFDSCTYQYWSYVLSSRQEPDKEAQINKQITDAKTDLINLAEQMQKYYPNTPQADLKNVADDAAQKIFNALDALWSNGNRRNQGVGTADDANARCQKISTAINVDFASPALNAPASGTAPTAPTR